MHINPVSKRKQSKENKIKTNLPIFYISPFCFGTWGIFKQYMNVHLLQFLFHHNSDYLNLTCIFSLAHSKDKS